MRLMFHKNRPRKGPFFRLPKKGFQENLTPPRERAVCLIVRQVGFGFGKFAFELRHQVCRGLHLVDDTNALATTPNVFPCFALVATKVHFAGVALRQVVRVHPCITHRWGQVVAMHAGEKIAIDDVV